MSDHRSTTDAQQPDARQPGEPDRSATHYDADPDAAMAAVIDAFLAAVGDAFAEQHDLIARVSQRHADLVARHAEWLVDEPARHNLALALALLAAYQELAPDHPDRRLLPVLQRAFIEPMAEPIRAGTAAGLDAAADPFALMVQISRNREEHAFGAGFDFAHPADDDQEYLADVRRCYYHDVLAANDATHLTPLLCAWDANWIDAIDPDRHGFTFDRATTIGTGGTHCPFRFRRTSPGP